MEYFFLNFEKISILEFGIFFTFRLFLKKMYIYEACTQVDFHNHSIVANTRKFCKFILKYSIQKKDIFANIPYIPYFGITI